jgi:hypothetical protein
VLVSGSYDTTVRFWDLNTFRCMRKCDGHNDAVRVLAAYNGRVFSGSYDGTIGVSEAQTVAAAAAGVGDCAVLVGTVVYLVMNAQLAFMLLPAVGAGPGAIRC